MPINRHNYETYFLLWVDGELSAEEQDAVERFIAENPDMADELAMLQDTRLTADETVVFRDKAALLKNESTGICLANHEAYFLLYVDGELATPQQKEVELFVLQHPQLQPAFLLLQQTVLPQEELVFANKEQLYRPTEKKPVVVLMWRRIAVAAALMGLMFSVWMLAPDDFMKKNKPFDGKVSGTASSPQTADQNKGQTAVLQHNQNSLAGINNKTLVTNSLSDNPKTGNDKVENSPQNTPPNVYGTAVAENISEPQKNTVADTHAAIIAGATIDEAAINNHAARMQHTENDPADLVQPAVYKELDTEDNDKSLFIGSLEINKDKLRGFIRKAGTLFRSKSKQEDDKTDTNQ